MEKRIPYRKPVKNVRPNAVQNGHDARRTAKLQTQLLQRLKVCPASVKENLNEMKDIGVGS